MSFQKKKDRNRHDSVLYHGQVIIVYLSTFAVYRWQKMWQSTRGKWWLTHWDSLLRWIWSISEYAKRYSPSQVWPQTMCHSHSWPQQKSSISREGSQIKLTVYHCRAEFTSGLFNLCNGIWLFPSIVCGWIEIPNVTIKHLPLVMFIWMRFLCNFYNIIIINQSNVSKRDRKSS